MDTDLPTRIRRTFLDPRPHVTLRTAAELLGIPLKELKRDIRDGTIVAVSSPLGLRVTRAELLAAAFRLWERVAIEEALGEEALALLPDPIRLVLLQARVPRYQRDALEALARREGSSVDQLLTRELEDVVCAHAEELAGVVPGLDVALSWPSNGREEAWVNNHPEQEVTRFETSLRTRGIRPARLAAVSGYSRQHLLRLRQGSGRATRRCMMAIAEACAQLLGRGRYGGAVRVDRLRFALTRDVV
jgi:hypothetical protein